MVVTASALRTQFFEYVYGDEKGVVCIATQSPGDKTTFRQQFFQWPVQKNDMAAFVQDAANTKNVWYCVNLLSKSERKKENCLPTNLVWADLDTCNPTTIEPQPQCVIQSSPGRWQALWRLDEYVESTRAEYYSKKIAYAFIQDGADPSGWDLTQLLRVPLTQNFKYDIDGEAPEVALEQAYETLLPVEIFEAIEAPDLPNTDPDILIDGMPDISEVPEAKAVIYKYYQNLRGTPFVSLFEIEPDKDADWSAILWRLINVCCEAGMSDEEVFGVALEAKCNKYVRDKRPLHYLWREVRKAGAAHNRIMALTGSFNPLQMPEIITSAETDAAPRTIIDTYREWAVDATDAVPQYHDIGCFILLSTLMAAGLYCNVSYGKTIPNIWGLVLGDSTLTRKTTAMRMAMDFVAEIDRDLVLATDGSAEGILSGLSARPNRVSVYFKDEVSGFMDSVIRKDYLAGMPETMTQLYDVPEFFTRRLRKETITVVSPVFIFFGGGIRDKMYELISEEYILSGFLPRFLIVSGDADLKRIRRTGPANQTGSEQREKLAETFANLHERYNRTAAIELAGQSVDINANSEVVLTNDAWQRYGDIEEKMVNAAHESAIPMLALPTFERMSRSLLKMAMLLAAAESTEDTVVCEEHHVINAAKYIQEWGRFTVDLLLNSGKNITQRTIDKVLRQVERNPGVTRSEIMRAQHFTKKTMDEIQGTLEDRMQIITKREGRGFRFWPV